MSREPRHFLQDIRERCENVIECTSRIAFEQFLTDRLTYAAVERHLEVIGEAVKHLPKELRDQHPEVEWHRIAGLRDVLIHQYFDVDSEVVWNIVRNHVPQLLDHVSRILADMETTPRRNETS